LPEESLVSPPSTAEAIHDRRWAVLWVMNLSLVIVVAGNSSLNVALPSIVRDLDATSSQLQWIVDAYALVFAGLLLPMGALGDRFGRKGMLQGGLAVFALGSFLAIFATEPWHLIATRSLMGVGGAMIMPATLSIITNVFPPQERSKAIAIWAGFAGAGAALGPLLSGLLLEHYWFGSVFLINVPIVAVALVSGALLVPSSRDPRQRKLDPVGGLLSMVALFALLYAIIEGPERGWMNGATIGLFAAALVLGVAFVRWEQHTDEPMLPMDQFRDRRFSMGTGTIGLTFFAMFGTFFVASQYLQFVLGYSPLEAGLATLPMAVMMIIFAPRSAGFAERFGRDKVMAAGLTTVALGLLSFSFLTTHAPYVQVAIGLMLLGGGMSLTTAPATGAVMESMPLAKAGVGSAVNDTSREVGGSLGVAILGSILASGYRSSLDGNVLSQAPAEVAAMVREGVGTALAVADQAAANPETAQFAPLVRDTARTAFVDGMTPVFWAASAVALLTAGLVLKFMPSRGEVVSYEVGQSPEEQAHAAATAEAEPVAPLGS
jgi:EmrB/QacA subfamily drug resistance transporter